jgi:tRNA(adenine34) deaminase
MAIALQEAGQALNKGEIPVGALLVKDNEIIARAHNLVETEINPLRHAEMIVLEQLARTTQDKWTNGLTLYCTLEPCPMCAGAALLLRIERIVYGASDPIWGACGTVFNIPQSPTLNHHPEIIGGIMEEECGKILKEFFKQKRKFNRK